MLINEVFVAQVSRAHFLSTRPGLCQSDLLLLCHDRVILPQTLLLPQYLPFAEIQAVNVRVHHKYTQVSFTLSQGNQQAHLVY